MDKDMQDEFLAALWGKLATSGLPKDLQKKIYDGAREECEAYTLKAGREVRYESILLAMDVIQPNVTRHFPLGCQGLARYLAEAAERLRWEKIDLTQYAAAMILGYEATQKEHFEACVKALVEGGILQREVAFEDGDEFVMLAPDEVEEYLMRRESQLPMINPLTGWVSSDIEDKFITSYKVGEELIKLA